MKVYLGNQKINRSFIGNQGINSVKDLPGDLNFEYILVGGGGCGGQGGAGGGAGGVVSGSITLGSQFSGHIPVIIGLGGGTGSIGPTYYTGSNGGTSSFLNDIAIGGGAGGSADSGSLWTAGVVNGSTGGSGGGGSASTGSRGLGTIVQGFDGGWGPQGGGGGASEVGENATSIKSGDGGTGLYIWWNKYNSGSIADGGGGGSYTILGADIEGGIGGGPTGGRGGQKSANVGDTIQLGVSGSVGGGGGGGGSVRGNAPFTGFRGGVGGDGILLIRYAGTTPLASGGEIYTTGSYTVHAFTASGNFIV